MFQDGQRVALHREVPSSAAICTRPPVGDQWPSTAATIRMVQPPEQPPEPKPLEGHGDWQCPRTSPGLLPALFRASFLRADAIADLLDGAPSPYGGLMAQHTLPCVLNPHSSLQTTAQQSLRPWQAECHHQATATASPSKWMRAQQPAWGWPKGAWIESTQPVTRRPVIQRALDGWCLVLDWMPQYHSPPFLLRLQGLLTLFTEFFASFHHCTCTLSVPDQYWSL